MLIELTTEQVTNVKQVLFGKQKQANVTNEAVVKIIARALSSNFGEDVLNSEKSVVKACTDFLQKCIDSATDESFEDIDETVVMLLAGEKSLACLMSAGPKEVYSAQPNPESPKYIFRVIPLGDQPDIDMSAESDIPDKSDRPNLETIEVNPQCNSYVDLANELCKRILPFVTQPIVNDLPDNVYAQCLCAAEGYYRYKFDTVGNPSVLNRAKSLASQQAHNVIQGVSNKVNDAVQTSVINKQEKALTQRAKKVISLCETGGKSVDEIAIITGLSQENVIEILTANGYRVK